MQLSEHGRQVELLATLRREVVGLVPNMRTGTGTLNHPLMRAMHEHQLSQDQLMQFCDVRYHAASNFELLLERAEELAKADPNKAKLAEALHRNLCDERGLEHATKAGAHSAWRADFMEALQVPDVQKSPYPLYVFDKTDDLPTLVGMLLGAEFSIPPEDIRVLKALRLKFPELFTDPTNVGAATEAQKKATLYLEDHIAHDTAEHLPDLLGAVSHDFSEYKDQVKIHAGIERFTNERKGLFDHIQQQIGLGEAEQRSIG